MPFLNKARITDVFSRTYCCYSNLLCQENDNNVFTNDWAAFRHQDCGIN